MPSSFRPFSPRPRSRSAWLWTPSWTLWSLWRILKKISSNQMTAILKSWLAKNRPKIRPKFNWKQVLIEQILWQNSWQVSVTFAQSSQKWKIFTFLWKLNADFANFDHFQRFDLLKMAEMEKWLDLTDFLSLRMWF